jgi:ATP-dependent Clp protease ATP-binding subunit ClpC
VIVGWSQIIGGVLACIGQFLPRMTTAGLRFDAPIHMLIVGVASIVAGALLLSRHRFGVKASLAIQLFQVFAISGRGHWVFSTGVVLRFLLTDAAVGIQAGVGGQFYASVQSIPGMLNASGVFFSGAFRFGLPFESAEWFVGINLLALYFARRLWRLMRGIEERVKIRDRDREREQEQRAELIARGRETVAPQFDAEAKRIHDRSRDEAELLQHQYIGAEHILLAILRDGDNDGARAVAVLGVDITALMADVTSVLQPGKPKFNPHRLYPHTSRAALVLRFAVDGAASQGLLTASPGHILLAILREGRSVAAQALVRFGVNEAVLRTALAKSSMPVEGTNDAASPEDDATPPSGSEH